MAFCRKCGNRKPTRRAADTYFCQHCGMLPGLRNMDRAGNPTRELCASETIETEYQLRGIRPVLLPAIPNTE